MGNLLEFKQAEGIFKRHREPVPSTGAQILFFTGVRYCRFEDATVRPKRRSSRERSANLGSAKKSRRRA